MITIDDTVKGNLQIAKMIKNHDLESETIFFCDFPDNKSREIIKKLSDMGFEIGSHTMSHSKLYRAPIDLMEYELKTSKREIEDITGKKCRWFAYPYGQYTNLYVDAVKKAGYKFARTCNKRFINDYKRSCFELSGKNWEKAQTKKYPIYQIHYYNLERNNSFEQFNKFLEWYGKN